MPPNDQPANPMHGGKAASQPAASINKIKTLKVIV